MKKKICSEYFLYTKSIRLGLGAGDGLPSTDMFAENNQNAKVKEFQMHIYPSLLLLHYHYYNDK